MAKHVVQFSGGITSWATARLVKERFGDDNLVLLFADTLVEDEDLYRFNADVERDLGVPITRVADGRTPWQVFWDKRRIGNSQVAPCSYYLKILPCRRWLEANVDTEAVIYVGIDWTETDRLPAIAAGWKPWRVEAPLTEPPYHDKAHWLDQARRVGLEPPRLYDLGFAHNNCGGACVRGGQAQWAHLLQVFPDRFAEAERQEQDLRAHLGGDVAILRDRRGGVTRPLPLTVLRQRISSRATQPALDLDDWGGCGCMTALEPAVAR